VLPSRSHAGGAALVSRESAFLIGGGISIALGVVLGTALWVVKAGLTYPGAWFAAGGAIAFGGFFLYVSRDLRRYREAYVRALEAGESPPPGGPPL
jgi:hypothetical protein